MKAYKSQYVNNSSPKVNRRNRLSSLSQIRMVLLAITIFCVSCTPITPITLMLSITGMEAKSNLSFSPEMIDFGTRILKHTSSAQKVTIRNDRSEPVLIDQLSVTAGFSIVASSCPMPPEALAIQGTCTVELVFKPSLPGSWVGEFQVTYGQNHVKTIPLKGYAQVYELLASITH